MLKKIKRDWVAQALEAIGLAGVAVGVGLYSVAAGVIVGGVAVVAWSLLIFDTGNA